MRDALKLCYIGNGHSIHTQRWVAHFSKLGHDVHLISDREVDIDNVTVHHIDGTGNIAFVRKIFKCRKLVKEIEPDILHAHFVTNFGFLGAMTGFHPFVVSPWGSDIVRQPEESALLRFMVKYALRRADAILCIDDSLAQRVAGLIGDGEKSCRIGWGVNPDVFRPNNLKGSNDIRILYLRISHENYSTSTLLEAMPEVLKSHDNVKFVILKKGEQLDKTIAAINKMGMNGRIELIDPVPHEELPGLLNSCDIYLDTFYNPLPGSGIGMTALEAMGCALPVVLADTNGYGRYVTHKNSGYVYRGKDPKSLADALGELIRDGELRRRIGINARQYVLKNQNWHENMKCTEKFYMDLIKRGGAK